jgi:hypothetical protein
LITGIVHVFDIVDVVDWRTEDEAREHDADCVGGLVFLDILPNSQFGELFAGAVADIWILSLTGVLEGNLITIL